MSFKWVAILSIVSITVSLFFYILQHHRLEEFGGLSHIAISGLLLFLPFFGKTSLKSCPLNVVLYSLVVFLPITVFRFDIITLLVVFIYVGFLTFTICSKLKRREVEVGD